MTKEEYQAEREAIFNEFGKPEYGMDVSDPLNESAKRYRALQSRYKVSLMKEGQEKAKTLSIIAKEGVKSLGKEEKERYNRYVPELEIDDAFLESFTEKEKGVLRDHYANSSLKDSELATKHNLSRQQVTALLGSGKVRVLETRLFNTVVPFRVMLGLLRLIETTHDKTIIRLAESLNIIKNPEQTVNISSKPIDDPKAVELLKKLGDELA